MHQLLALVLIAGAALGEQHHVVRGCALVDPASVIDRDDVNAKILDVGAPRPKRGCGQPRRVACVPYAGEVFQRSIAFSGGTFPRSLPN